MNVKKVNKKCLKPFNRVQLVIKQEQFKIKKFHFEIMKLQKKEKKNHLNYYDDNSFDNNVIANTMIIIAPMSSYL